MTVLERSVQQLEAEEAAVSRGLDLMDEGLVLIGEALSRIHGHRLYRARGFTSFRAYCEAQWQRGRHWGYRMIFLAEVTGMLPIGTTLPESHARVLKPLRHDPEAVARIYDEQRQEHGEAVTAQHLALAVAAELDLHREDAWREVHAQLEPLAEAGRLGEVGVHPDAFDDLSVELGLTPESKLPSGAVPAESAEQLAERVAIYRRRDELRQWREELVESHADRVEVVVRISAEVFPDVQQHVEALKDLWQMESTGDVIAKALHQSYIGA
jgi:hypothetical protein